MLSWQLSPSLKDPSSDAATVRRLLGEFGARNAKSYALALGLGAVAAACTAATAYLVGTVVNEAYVQRNFSGIAALAAVVIVVFAAKGVSLYGSNLVLARISNGIVAEVQRRVFDKLLLESLGFYANRHSSQFLVKITQGARASAGALGTLVTSLGRDALTLAGLLAVMVIQEPLLSLIGLLVMPPAILFVRDLIRRTRELANSELRGGLLIFETIQETLRGLPVVKAFTLEDEMRMRIRGSIESVERKQNKLAALQNRASPVMEALGGVAIALVLLYGGYRVIELGATPGEFVSFITAFLLAYEPAKRLARVHLTLARSLRAVRMLFEILDSEATEPDEPENESVQITAGEIRFAGVGFGYEKNRPVLHDLSFLAEAGKMTALVGGSGGGKSTVIALVLRFYDGWSGTIEIDGHDIRQIPRKLLRRRIAYVGQDVFMFRGTVAENIRYGKLGATDEEIEAAAKRAFAHDFITRLPKGYDTDIGESGVKLSTGQRQRIAVARALIRDAPIILLDEATSALDSKAEREVQRAIEHLREGRTCIAVAHRLHTIAQADRIHVLDHGRILESGTHDELMRRGSHYAEMYHAQSGAGSRGRADETDIDEEQTVLPVRAAG